jgi:hypothetical protein
VTFFVLRARGNLDIAIFEWLSNFTNQDLQEALARTLHIPDVGLPELRRAETRNRLDQNSDLLLGADIHAAGQHNPNLAALEAPLAGAFQFGGEPMARILSVEVSPATALLADENNCPIHWCFGIADELLRSTHKIATCSQPCSALCRVRLSDLVDQKLNLFSVHRGLGELFSA